VESTLQQAGVDVTAVQTSCDIGAAQQQVPSAVLQMRQAGVTRVFLGSIFSTAQTFMQQADAQAWKPQYSVSDLWANNVNFTAKNFPPSQFDRTIGTAHNFSGGEAAQVPYSPGVQRCNAIITNAGLPPVTDQSGADAEVVSLCDAFFVWLAVTDKLPVNFTRADWATAVPQVGQFQMATSTASATFGPGKFEGGDAYALVEWRKECTCWFEIRGHQPAKY
jgi:hypothetical protein